MATEGTRFGVLGPLVAWRDAANGRSEIDLGPPRQRAVLAALLLRPRRVVDVDELLEAVWGDLAPKGGANVVQTYISALKLALEPGRTARHREGILTSVKGGYRLDIEPGSVDFERAEARLERARERRDLDELRDILRLWRGTPLAGLPGPFAKAQRTRLGELRTAVLEEYYEACLARGIGSEIIGELAVLVEEHPLRERVRALLMRALDQDGRRADALRVFREGRRLLIAQQGFEPGRELQRLHHRILAADADPAVPRQLPGAVYAFTGRRAELAQLDRLMHKGSTVPIALVVGPAGVGKTSLTVQWARDNVDRFPDGQLFVDLRGFGHDRSRTPEGVLTALLAALGVPPGRIPTDPDDARVLLRTMTADRRMLLVLDNAGSPEDVRRLLPGSPSVAVVVTSRDELTGLVAQEGAFRVRVEPLRTDESEELLQRLLGRTDRELADLCGHLPLALRIAAANLAPLEPCAAEGYRERLRTSDRLEALQVAGDEQLAVSSAFHASYDALPADVARDFGLLAALPGEASGLHAVAALTGRGPDETAEVLRTLVGRHLVEGRPNARYALHDLLRDFARRLVDPADREAALRRVLDYYMHSVGAALTYVSPGWIDLPAPEKGVVPETFESEAAALEWFDRERRNLIDAVSAADAAGLDDYTWRLARAPVTLFQMRGRFHDWIRTHGVALHAAQRLDDKGVEATTIRSLAYAYLELERPEVALRWYERAVELDREQRDRAGEAATREGLATVYRQLGRTDEAMAAARSAIELYREHGDRFGECNALTQLALDHRDRGEFDQAVECWEQCRRIRRETGFRLGEAMTLADFGETYRRAGRLEEARARLEEAVPLLREVGHRHGLAKALRDLGRVLWALDEPEAARTQWRESLDLFEEVESASAEEVRALLNT